MDVPTLASLIAEGKKPEVLFWVGCAGSFDERAKKNIQILCQNSSKSRSFFCRFGN
jgi:hypothetical protein